MPDTVVHERTDSGSSAGLILGIVIILLVGMMALFFIFGGPGRLGPAPSGQTNVNVPSQQQPQAPSGPNIQVPRQIDVNVNQGGQPPAQQAPAQQAPAGGAR